MVHRSLAERACYCGMGDGDRVQEVCGAVRALWEKKLEKYQEEG